MLNSISNVPSKVCVKIIVIDFCQVHSVGGLVKSYIRVYMLSILRIRACMHAALLSCQRQCNAT